MDYLKILQHRKAQLNGTPIPPPKPPPEVGGGNKGGGKLVLVIVALSLCAIVPLSLYFFWNLPDPAQLTTKPAAASTKLLDRNGKLLYEIFATERRTPIKLTTLPKHVWQATLAAEDKDFYKHSGFSPRGLLRALVNTVFRSNTQGGSTITQQLVKKALLSDERTVKRKVREFALSMLVELRYSKDQILEMYLNQVPYGGTAYGLEAAAQTYFGKKSIDLTVAESAMLAGLPQAPSLYSPFGSRPELGKSRQVYVLKLMLDNNFIDQSQYNQALSENLEFVHNATLQAPHFSLWVKDLLASKYGLDRVEREGWVITTSLDLDLQLFAESAVASEVAKLKREKVGNGAALVTNPKTGEILAMVGSKDYFNIKDEGNVNVVLAQRQPGSAIKPINYALGIDRKLFTAATLLADKPTCFKIPDQKDYCPENYDSQFHGPTQVRYALANSFNIPAVKALTLNGLEDFVASASAFGLNTLKDPTKYGPSLTLGGGEVTLLDLTTAYSVLANAGKRVDLNPILEVRDREGKLIEKVPALPSNTRVISPGAAFIVSHILSDAGARAATFGERSYLNIKNHPEVAVKTGTTNDKRDNWTMGYNPDVLVGVWVGNNDNTPMANIASGVTGASPIWNKIMTQVLIDAPQHWISQPPDVTGAMVCSISGLRASDPPPDGCGPRYEYFLIGTQPGFGQTQRQDISIFKPSNAPATRQQIEQQPGDVEMQNHAVVYDPLGTMLCVDCAGGLYGGTDLIRLDRHGRAIKN